MMSKDLRERPLSWSRSVKCQLMWQSTQSIATNVKTRLDVLFCRHKCESSRNKIKLHPIVLRAEVPDIIIYLIPFFLLVFWSNNEMSIPHVASEDALGRSGRVMVHDMKILIGT